MTILCYIRQYFCT